MSATNRIFYAPNTQCCENGGLCFTIKTSDDVLILLALERRTENGLFLHFPGGKYDDNRINRDKSALDCAWREAIEETTKGTINNGQNHFINPAITKGKEFPVAHTIALFSHSEKPFILSLIEKSIQGDTTLTLPTQIHTYNEVIESRPVGQHSVSFTELDEDATFTCTEYSFPQQCYTQSQFLSSGNGPTTASGTSTPSQKAIIDILYNLPIEYHRLLYNPVKVYPFPPPNLQSAKFHSLPVDPLNNKPYIKITPTQQQTDSDWLEPTRLNDGSKCYNGADKALSLHWVSLRELQKSFKLNTNGITQISQIGDPRCNNITLAQLKLAQRTPPTNWQFDYLSKTTFKRHFKFTGVDYKSQLINTCLPHRIKEIYQDLSVQWTNTDKKIQEIYNQSHDFPHQWSAALAPVVNEMIPFLRVLTCIDEILQLIKKIADDLESCGKDFATVIKSLRDKGTSNNDKLSRIEAKIKLATSPDTVWPPFSNSTTPTETGQYTIGYFRTCLINFRSSSLLHEIKQELVGLNPTIIPVHFSENSYYYSYQSTSENQLLWDSFAATEQQCFHITTSNGVALVGDEKNEREFIERTFFTDYFRSKTLPNQVILTKTINNTELPLSSLVTRCIAAPFGILARYNEFLTQTQTKYNERNASTTPTETPTEPPSETPSEPPSETPTETPRVEQKCKFGDCCLASMSDCCRYNHTVCRIAGCDESTCLDNHLCKKSRCSGKPAKNCCNIHE